MRLLEIIAVVALTAFAVVFLFTGATFALAARYQKPRALSRSVVEVLREAAWSCFLVLTLPPYQVLGRRMGRGTGGLPVVLVHGYTQNRADFLRMAHLLGRGAVGPLYGFNYSWLQRVEPCAERLQRFVEAVCAETGASQVDLVCHSLGGLVARAMIASDVANRVRSAVTLGSPHAGVTWRLPLLGGCGPQMKIGSPFLSALAKPLPVPCLSLFSTHDNIVHPPETSSLSALGGTDGLLEGGYGHLSLLFVAEVAERVRRFLEAQPIGEAPGRDAEIGLPVIQR